MRGSYRLGQAFGIGVFVHWSFALLLGYVVMTTLAGGGGWVIAFNSVVFVLAVFACVLLHEFGHCLVARRYGIGTHDITLLPIGGVARLERIPEEPRQELWIALAGPAVNVVIAAALSLAAVVLGVAAPPTGLVMMSDAAILYGLIYTNIVLVLFNMLPAFPMDGGRVLRALLAIRGGTLAATETAASIGKVMAVLMVFGGFFWTPFLFLTAIFVFVAGQAELQAVRERHAPRGNPFEEILRQAFEVHGGSAPPKGEPKPVRGRVIEVK